jgi:hypothetical protein
MICDFNNVITNAASIDALHVYSQLTRLFTCVHTTHRRRMCKGTRVGPYDFRNESLVQFFINDYIGGPDCVGNPDVDGACERVYSLLIFSSSRC